LGFRLRPENLYYFKLKEIIKLPVDPLHFSESDSRTLGLCLNTSASESAEVIGTDSGNRS
jgi:hypothetical protein